ncbi:MAG: hypothetical protein WCP29_01780 [Acidobacteriota bacterium]
MRASCRRLLQGGVFVLMGVSMLTWPATAAAAAGARVGAGVRQAGGFKGPKSGGPATGTVSGRMLTYNGAKYSIVDGKVTFPDCTLFIATDSGLLIPAGMAPGCTPPGGGGQAQATPAVTWAAPASVVAGSVLGAFQLNASANVPGAFLYDPPAGTALTPGTMTVSMRFTPNDRNAFATVTRSESLTVLPRTAFTGPKSGGPATGSVSNRVLSYNRATYPVVNGKVAFPDCTLFIATDSGLLIPAGAAPGCTPDGNKR